MRSVTIAARIIALSASAAASGRAKARRSARGGKGQTARSGVALNGFEGGQTPLHRRLPKRGFDNRMFRKDFKAVNLGRVQRAIDAGKLKTDGIIDGAALVASGVLRRRGAGVRLLAKGNCAPGSRSRSRACPERRSGRRRGGRQGCPARPRRPKVEAKPDVAVRRKVCRGALGLRVEPDNCLGIG